MKILYIVYCLLSIVQPVFASDAYFLSYTDKKKITIGDRIKLTLNLEYSRGTKFAQFDPGENLKNFEIKDYKITKEQKKYFLFGRYKKTYKYILSTFTTGIYEIKPFVVDFTDKNGVITQSRTNLIKIEVTSLLDKESASDIRDIKPPVMIKSKLFPYVFIILLILITGIFTLGYFRSVSPSCMLSEIIDPYKYASDELKKLESMELIKKGLSKEFYIRLTQIVRVYLSKIFSVNILDMTTSESMRALREKSTDKKFLIIVREFFESADLVKFAKYLPQEKKIIFDFECAKNIVEMVKPENTQKKVSNTEQ